MFENLGVFQLASGAMMHAGKRQTMTAMNIANADTPGYTAREMAGFADALNDAPPMALRQTRAGHLTASPALGPLASGVTNTGQVVSIETEMLTAADSAQQHARALGVYRSALGLMRTSLGKL